VSRKIAIVAKAATAAFAPYEDPGWEVWGMPWVVYRRLPDLHFDPHSASCWDGMKMPQHEREEFQARANTSGVPMLCHPTMVGAYVNARAFPFEDVAGSVYFPLFENTIAFQIAYAIYLSRREPVDEIGLFGVHMMGEREYLWERCSVLYMIGIAQERGITVTIPPGSPLFMSYWEAGRYGESTKKRFDLNL
jgi:hypothetical protein